MLDCPRFVRDTLHLEENCQMEYELEKKFEVARLCLKGRSILCLVSVMDTRGWVGNR